MKKHLAVVALVLLSAVARSATAPAATPKYVDPTQVDADFAIQGEYAGNLSVDGDTMQLGIQVVALGKGRFLGVAYEGGLPGAGWTKDKPARAEAQLKDGVVKFVAENGIGLLQNGKLTVQNPDGKKLGVLPRVARKSPTEGQKPPAGAVVLFDGTPPSLENWRGGRMTDDGLLMQGTTSKRTFRDHKLHCEFRLAYQPEDRGQGRSNSGLYVQGRYEIQILDSFGLEGKQNESGGIYSVKDPDVNMCFPPLVWQTYDIDFTAAKYDASGQRTANPRITVRHNGIVVHKDVELPGDRNTTAAPVKAGSEPGPIYLQDHGCPVRYRNIWVEER